jgi:hypothetical protein
MYVDGLDVERGVSVGLSIICFFGEKEGGGYLGLVLWGVVFCSLLDIKVRPWIERMDGVGACRGLDSLPFLKDGEVCVGSRWIPDHVFSHYFILRSNSTITCIPTTSYRRMLHLGGPGAQPC